MKALKLKSSPKENPVWGYATKHKQEHHKWDVISETEAPSFFSDHYTMDIIKRESKYPEALEEWELVPIIISTP